MVALHDPACDEQAMGIERLLYTDDKTALVGECVNLGDCMSMPFR